ncbi:internal scaffolding protein [Apis mellifera associated microvirus 10]|nr:internal scaffolding protein [Apis mellifera associated microvirus 10]
MTKKKEINVVDTGTGELSTIGVVTMSRAYVRNPFSRMRVVTDVGVEDATDQTHAESVDVNSIIRKYKRTGVLPPPRPGRVPQYADVTGLQDGTLTEQLQRAREARAAVAEARQRFAKDKQLKQKELLAEAAKIVKERDSAAATAKNSGIPATPVAENSKPS